MALLRQKMSREDVGDRVLRQEMAVFRKAHESELREMKDMEQKLEAAMGEAMAETGAIHRMRELQEEEEGRDEGQEGKGWEGEGEGVNVFEEEQEEKELEGIAGYGGDVGGVDMYGGGGDADDAADDGNGVMVVGGSDEEDMI
jgi:hypothetical protein